MERNESTSYSAENMDEKTRVFIQNTQLPKHHRQPLLLDRKTTSLESHQLIWLSSSSEFQPTKILRKIVDYVNLFDNVNTCQMYIERMKDTVIFLVCAQEFVHNLISQISHVTDVYLIYVYASAETLENMTTATTTTTTKTFSQQQSTSIYKKVDVLRLDIYLCFSFNEKIV